MDDSRRTGREGKSVFFLLPNEWILNSLWKYADVLVIQNFQANIYRR